MQFLLKRPLFFLIAVSVLLYANTFFNGYVLDDLCVVKQNDYVTQGVKAIPQLLTTPYLKGFREKNDANDNNDVYRPLSLVMFATEYSLFGPAPAWNHLVNILLFAGCVVLLFLLLDLLFERRKTGIAFIAALLFALHPVHTEVVANIKSRDELLCFFFAFASLLAFTRYAGSGKWPALSAGMLCYFLSLLSRETSVSFLLVIPLVFFFYRNEHKKRSTYITIASIIAAGIYFGIRYVVLKNNHVAYTGSIAMIDNSLAGAPSASSALATAIFIMGYYIRLLFVPYPLVSEYGYNTIPPVSMGNVWCIISLLVYAGLAVFAIYRLLKRKKDPYAFGIFFFLLTIAMFSNILFLIGATLAERFLFFPSVGFCLCVAALVWRAVGGKEDGGSMDLLPKKAWWILSPLGIVCALLTITRNADWKDNYTLFSADAAHHPNSARLWHSLGFELSTTVLDDEPDNAKKREIIQQAIADVGHAVAIYPAYSKAHYDLANMFIKVQRYDSAETHQQQVVALNPNDVAGLSQLGYIYFLKKEYPKTIVLCRQILQITPGNVTIMNNMAMSYTQMQQYDSVIAISKRALALEPANKLAQDNLDAATHMLKVADTVKK